MSTGQGQPQIRNRWAQDIANAQESGGGSYVTKHGKYLFCLKGTIDKTEKTDEQGRTVRPAGFKGNSLVFLVVVISAEATQLTKPEFGTHEVGEELSVVFNLDDQSKVARGKLRAFLRALYGVADQAATPQWVDSVWNEVVDPKGPMIGKFLKGITWEFTNQGRFNPQNKGNKGTAVNWEHVEQAKEGEGLNPPSIAAARVMMLEAATEAEAPAAS